MGDKHRNGAFDTAHDDSAKTSALDLGLAEPADDDQRRRIVGNETFEICRTLG